VQDYDAGAGTDAVASVRFVQSARGGRVRVCAAVGRAVLAWDLLE